MAKRTKREGAIFGDPGMELDDPAESYARMTSVSPWCECITKEVNRWTRSKAYDPDTKAAMLSKELLTLVKNVRPDRPDMLIELGRTWCQWQVMALGFEHFADIGKERSIDTPRKMRDALAEDRPKAKERKTEAEKLAKSFIKSNEKCEAKTVRLHVDRELRRAAVRKLPKLLFEEIGDGVKMHAI